MADTVTSNSDTAEFRIMLTPTELVRLNAPAVLAVCLVYTTNIHDAEDVMQSVFVKAFTKIKTLRDPKKIRPWLLQIARRMCVDLYRRRPPPQIDDLDKLPARQDYDPQPMARLHAALIRLPREYRETISLYYLDSRNCASVAQTLNTSESAIRQRLVRGRLMLHHILREVQNNEE